MRISVSVPQKYSEEYKALKKELKALKQELYAKILINLLATFGFFVIVFSLGIYFFTGNLSHSDFFILVFMCTIISFIAFDFRYFYTRDIREKIRKKEIEISICMTQIEMNVVIT